MQLEEKLVFFVTGGQPTGILQTHLTHFLQLAYNKQTIALTHTSEKLHSLAIASTQQVCTYYVFFFIHVLLNVSKVNNFTSEDEIWQILTL